MFPKNPQIKENIYTFFNCDVNINRKVKSEEIEQNQR